jgi:thiamine-monophosphate kinase
VYTEKIPIAEESVKMAEEFNMDPITAALNGGEDYELLFTADLKNYEQLLEMEDVSIIGHIVDKKEGRKLVTPNGTTIDIQAQGWQHQ